MFIALIFVGAFCIMYVSNLHKVRAYLGRDDVYLYDMQIYEEWRAELQAPRKRKAFKRVTPASVLLMTAIRFAEHLRNFVVGVLVSTVISLALLLVLSLFV